LPRIPQIFSLASRVLLAVRQRPAGSNRGFECRVGEFEERYGGDFCRTCRGTSIQYPDAVGTGSAGAAALDEKARGNANAWRALSLTSAIHAPAMSNETAKYPRRISSVSLVVCIGFSLPIRDEVRV
jgi:hypothetical protein